MFFLDFWNFAIHRRGIDRQKEYRQCRFQVVSAENTQTTDTDTATSKENLSVLPADGNLSIQKYQYRTNEYFLSAEKKRSEGGKYYLDENITDITGDFYSRGGKMRAYNVSEAGVKKVIDYLYEKTKLRKVNSGGVKFSMPSDIGTEQSAANILSQSDDTDISQMVLSEKATNQAEALKALERLAGKDITNRETGIKAQINSTQRNKLVSTVALSKSKNNGFSFEDHFAAVANIDKLFENGTMVDDRTDKSGDPNIVSIKRFVAPVLLGEDFAEAYITVKETAGNKIYSLELDELKKPSDITGGTLKERYPIPEGYTKLLQKIEKAREVLKKSNFPS